MTPQDPSPAPSAPADLARLLDLYESTARAVGLAIGARTHADVDEKRAAAARGLVDAAFRALVEERDQWRHIGHLAEKAVEYARSQRAAALSRADEADAALRLSQEAIEVCVACENAMRARAAGEDAGERSEDAAPVICPRCQVTNWDPLAAAAHARWCTASPVTPTNEDHDHE